MEAPVPTSDPSQAVSIIGETFGPYKIISQIRRGGMGELFLAETVDGSKVVLKRLLADFFHDERYVAMFRSEAQVMSHLDHPNIVKVFDVPIIGGMQCLAMEYVQGRNIQQVLERCESLGSLMPPHAALFAGIEMLRGLHYAHTFVMADGHPLDLVHRDVTPQNVLCSFVGDVKITDFGIAKSKMSSVSTTIGVVKGTTSYLSPEQIRGEFATPRSDIFSSGAAIVEMLTGKALFDRGSVPPTLFAIVTGERPSIEELLQFRAPRACAALECALQVNPNQRFETAEAFANALEEALPEIGSPMDREGLGIFLKQLFHGTGDLYRFEDDGNSSVPGLDAVDLNYLFDSQESAWGSSPDEERSAPDLEKARAVLHGLGPGASPLDAQQFEQQLETPKVPASSVDDLVLEAPPIPKGTSGATFATVAKSNPDIRVSSSGIRPVSSSDIDRVESEPFHPTPAEVRKGRPWIGAVLFVAGILCGALGMWGVLRSAGTEKPVVELPEVRVPEPKPDPVNDVRKVEIAPVEVPVVEPETPVVPGKGFIDIRRPRGARVRIDGILLRKRVPIRKFTVESGHRQIRVYKRGYNKTYEIDIEKDQRVNLNSLP